MKRKDPLIKFYLHGVSDSDLAFVKSIFIERYFFEPNYLNDVQPLNSISQLYQLPTLKNLMLDVHTFERVFPFLRGEILCYSNESNGRVRSSKKKVTYYGWYPYQSFDKKTLLKFYFDIYRPIQGDVDDKVLVSGSYKSVVLPPHLENKKVLNKKKNNHYNDFFRQFDTLYYYQTGLDTNNRLIPECFFYDKSLFLENSQVYNDSVYLRYRDIKENGLGKYTLDESDVIVRDFLSDT